jgi:hypothetical protein
MSSDTKYGRPSGLQDVVRLQGRVQTVAAWLEELGMKASTYRLRLKRWGSSQLALEEPVRPVRRRR